MTPFAAGCALCGADLDPLRHRAGPSVSQRMGSRASALWMGPTRAKPLFAQWRSDPKHLVGFLATWLYGGLVLGAVVAGVAILLSAAG